MSDARWIVGDALTILRTLPEESVDLIMTSPPFLALRSYLPADHPYKNLEIGSEPTPADFIDTLLDVIEECRRILAPHGSIAIELGDTYAGSGGAGGDYNSGGMRDGQERFDGAAARERTHAQKGRWRTAPDSRHDRGNSNRDGAPGGPGWPLDKSLCLIPESFRWALVYGRNPFNGRTTPQWRARNVVRWCRPNPPVGALADKFRPATSELIVACIGRQRYFDLDAVRQAPSPNTHARTAKDVVSVERNGKSADRDGNWATLPELHETDGAPPLDWWPIPAQPYRGSHYATYPEHLCVTPMKAMCPEKVCTVCGKPSERIVTAAYLSDHDDSTRKKPSGRLSAVNHPPEIGWERSRETTGWTDCGCSGGNERWRNGLVLDPFAGSGTTGAVAVGHGRNFLGIDLDERNAWLARDRIGMWLTIEQPNPVGETA